MKTTIKIKLGEIVVILCGLYPLIAEINDYTEKNISVPYVITICLVVFLAIERKKVSIKKNRMLSVLFFCITTAFSIFVGGFISSNQLNYMYAIKLIINLFFALLLIIAYEGKILDGSDYYKALNLSSWVFIFCLIIPKLFNVGSSVYAGAFGYKAFYQAQNEISAVIIILFFYSLYDLSLNIEYFSKKNFFSLLRSGLLLACAMLVSTKSVLILCFIGIVYCIINLLSKSRLKHRFIILIILILMYILFKDNISHTIQGVFERYNLQLTKNYNNNTVSAVFSSRNSYVSEEWKSLITSKFVVLKLLIGNGFRFIRPMEIDPIDMFFWLGMFGFVSLILFLKYIFDKSKKNFKEDKTKLRLVAYICLIFYMSLAGHVIFYSLSGFYFALMCAFDSCFGINEKEKLLKLK